MFQAFKDSTIARYEEFIKASLEGCFSTEQRIAMLTEFKSKIQNAEYIIGRDDPSKQLQMNINRPASAKAAFTEIKPALDYIAQCLYEVNKEESLKFLYALSETSKQIADSEIRRGK